MSAQRCVSRSTSDRRLFVWASALTPQDDADLRGPLPLPGLSARHRRRSRNSRASTRTTLRSRICTAPPSLPSLRFCKVIRLPLESSPITLNAQNRRDGPRSEVVRRSEGARLTRTCLILLESRYSLWRSASTKSAKAADDWRRLG